MHRLLLLVAVLGLVAFGVHWLRTTPASTVARVLRRVLLWGALGLLVVAIASGRLTPLLAAIVAAVPAAIALLLRLLNLLLMLPLIQQALASLGLKSGRWKYAAGQSGAGGLSRIRTRYLEMTLDQSSGRMDGVVLDGPFSGAQLATLGHQQLERLLEFYEDSDAQSAAVLRAYLERTQAGARAHDGRDRAGPEPVRGQLTKEEARAILGIKPEATADAIRAAHRRLMQKLHPDRGGSNYLAAKINEAKQRLLDD